MHHLQRWLTARPATPKYRVGQGGWSVGISWAFSGALAASFGLGLFLLPASGNIFAASLQMALYSVYAICFLFWPFLLAHLMYLPLRRVFCTRAHGALYGALWHMVAHVIAVGSAAPDQMTSILLVPMLVGAVWGTGLPAVAASTRPSSRIEHGC